MPVALKEDDELIHWIRRACYGAAWGIGGKRDIALPPSGPPVKRPIDVRDAFARAEALMRAHHAAPVGSELSQLCPSVSPIFLELDLMAALDEFDGSHGLTRRLWIPPSFAEVRKVLNLSVVNAATGIKLLTLDADDTIYSDGLTLLPDRCVGRACCDR